MLRIAVIDGQGGGIGSLIVKRLRAEFGRAPEISDPSPVFLWDVFGNIEKIKEINNNV